MHLALQWIGRPYEVEHLDFKDMKFAEYLTINPSGFVPTSVDGELNLPEGMAIIGFWMER